MKKIQQAPQIGLICSNGNRTIVQNQENRVDATTKRLLEQRRELELERFRIGRDIDAIDRALTLAGVKPDKDTGAWMKESEYASRQMFKGMRLKDACLMILRDSPKVWFTKAQIEYMLVRGGCEFATADTKNSVDVTLRRLADDALCDAERTRGSGGNRYRNASARDDTPPDAEDSSNDVEDSGTTK